MTHEGERTFLVDSYIPRLDQQTAAAISSRFRAAAQELGEQGVTLHWLRSFALIDEETHLCIVAAPDRDHVVRLSQQVGLEYDHVVEMFAIDAFALGPGSTLQTATRSS